jgi:hypothetical protein
MKLSQKYFKTSFELEIREIAGTFGMIRTSSSLSFPDDILSKFWVLFS